MKVQPKKSVTKIVCPTCGELMVKLYPYSSYAIREASVIIECRKCLGKKGYGIVGNKVQKIAP